MMKFTIEQARKYAGFTQKKFCEKLGITLDVYRRIAANSASTEVPIAKKISLITGIPLDDIIF